MNNIKIRYTFRHKGSGNIEMKWYNIDGDSFVTEGTAAEYKEKIGWEAAE
ncbi:hypothetical protein [Bacillus sp. JJ675]